MNQPQNTSAEKATTQQDSTSLATTFANKRSRKPHQKNKQNVKPGSAAISQEAHPNPTNPKKKGKKNSISDSGPFIFAFDPAQGKEVLQKNPHWPNEDTWKREEEMKGQWAVGGEMGQQKQDFGGTVG